MKTRRTTDPPIPPGFHANTPEQLAKLAAATQAAFEVLAGTVDALAIVVAMPDGTVSAGLAGDVEKLPAMALLMTAGPEVLRVTVERMIAGKGTTKIVERGSGRS